jgi:putative transcriptional regulator
MVVHGDEALSQIEVTSGVHFCTDKDSIQQLVTDNEGPMKFFVGYAGWAPGQLENELEEGAWLATTATSQQVFEDDDDQWATLVKQISRATAFPWIDPKLIPEDPSLN